MKLASFICVVAFGALLADASLTHGDRTITKVVKLLQNMVAQSKKDGDSDRVAYAKYKCVVDQNEVEKTANIKKLTGQISLLGNKIDELQSRNSELSTQTASLNADIPANTAQQASATAVRTSSAASFDQMEADLVRGIGQMSEAISVLKALALPQTQSTHKKETALLSLGSAAQQSLRAATALLPADKHDMLESFLQAPLATGASSKGDAIVKVLQSLHDTFASNLKNARDSEAAEKKAFDDAITVLSSSLKAMEDSNKAKGQEMGTNDNTLGTKKAQYEVAVAGKESDEDFLATLKTTSTKKAKNYDTRKMLRANEDAAIAQAIVILDSDDAFSNFGDVTATKTGATKASSFLQVRQLRGGSSRPQLEALLDHAAGKVHSTRLALLAQGLRSGNPFTSVLAEIAKMKKTIADEGVADKENSDWCQKERSNSNADMRAKNAQIATLTAAVDNQNVAIDDPAQGLKDGISDKETALLQNSKAQTDETAARNGENAAYIKNVQDLSEAEGTLGKAVAVLKNYYAVLDKHMTENADSTNLLQTDAESAGQPAGPGYGDFGGQKQEGNKAVVMLEFILSETKKEHSQSDSTEASAKADFDASLAKLKASETKMQASLISLQASLGGASTTLVEKSTDLKDTNAAKAAIQAYLLSIKPGCDFISTHRQVRIDNRKTETDALDKAISLIKATPAYTEAVAAVAAAAVKCKGECKLDNSDLGCKACMDGKSKADYCKANASFPGCK